MRLICSRWFAVCRPLPYGRGSSGWGCRPPPSPRKGGGYPGGSSGWGRRFRLPLLLLLAVTAYGATRPHYGGTLRVEIRESSDVMGSTPGFTVASWLGRRAVLTPDDNTTGGRPFLDSVEIEMGRPLRDQALDFGLGKVDVVE